MDFTGNFIKLGTIEIASLRAKVDRQGEDVWAGDSFRQRKYRAHEKTQTLKLVYDTDFRHTNPTWHPKTECYRAAWLMDPDPISRTLSDGFPRGRRAVCRAEGARFWPGPPLMS